jgi:hypothetical protein
MTHSTPLTFRAVCACLSLANLLLERYWEKVLSVDFAYHAERSQVFGSWAGVLLVVLSLTLVFCGLVAIVKYASQNRYDRWSAFFCVGLLLLVNRLTWPEPGHALARTILFALWLGTLVLSILVVFWQRFDPRWVTSALLVGLAFLAINLGTVAVRIFQFQSAFKDRPLKASGSSEVSRRVVWIILDEFDYRLAFAARPSSLSLPELDQLRSQSIYASNSFPPPGRETAIALPALISGQELSGINPYSPNHLQVLPVGQNHLEEWDAKGTIFSDAALAGKPAAIVGFFNPYCRLIPDLTSCSTGFESNEIVEQAIRKNGFPGVVSAMEERIRAFPEQIRRSHMEIYKNALAHALVSVGDQHIALIMLHLPIPHPPGIYDRTTSQLSTSAKSSYLDNLALADRTLGEIRKAMERSNLWDKTTLIVSGDHGLRESLYRAAPFWTEEDKSLGAGPIDYRVPFLIKVAGQQDPIQLDFSFNTVITRRLIHEFLNGKLSTGKDVAAWLEANRVPPGPEAARQGIK